MHDGDSVPYFGSSLRCSGTPSVCNDQGWKEQTRQTRAMPPFVPADKQHKPKAQTVHSGQNCRSAEYHGEEILVHPLSYRTETGGRTGDHNQKNPDNGHQNTADQGRSFPDGFPLGRLSLGGLLTMRHSE